MTRILRCNRCSHEVTGVSPCVRCHSREFRIQQEASNGEEGNHQKGSGKAREEGSQEVG